MTQVRSSAWIGRIFKTGCGAATLALCLGLPACSDNPEGNPNRESITAPRDKVEGGGGAPAGSGKDAGKKGTSDAARKIDI